MQTADSLLVLSILLCLNEVVCSECSKHMYGPKCIYWCYCEGFQCDHDSNECYPGFMCLKYNFGPGCQYSDGAKELSEISPLHIITDYDEFTCVPHNINRVLLSFPDPVAFSWLRLIVKAAKHSVLDLSANTNISFDFVKLCLNERRYRFSSTTLDISCDMAEKINVILITGQVASSLCTVKINSGRNIALGRNVSQSSTYPGVYDASLAVDGRSNSSLEANTCSLTADTSDSVWTLIFPFLAYLIRGFIIKDDTILYHLGIFNLTTFNQEGDVVETFKATNQTASTYTFLFSRSHTLQTLVKSVTITQSVDELQLCEVLLYGEFVCPDDWWGAECSFQCNCSNSESCFLATGICGEGCASGKYGFGCGTACPVNCLDRCKYRFGDCYGCKPGFTGSRCEANCPAGTFGYMCSSQCSPHCVSKTCSHITGECSVGCIPGFYGSTCEESCPPRCYNGICLKQNGTCFSCHETFYGPKCASYCSDSCDKKLCDFKTGDCSLCVQGKFGHKCERPCPLHCVPRACTVDNGLCYSCEKGYFGTKCETSCPFYCKNNECNSNNGFCEICDDGFFGEMCNKKCSDHCVPKTCNFSTGACLACQKGSYSITCKLDCPINCAGSRCHVMTGVCDACAAGFYGNDCFKTCKGTGNCKDGKCDKVNGRCLSCTFRMRGEFCEQLCPEQCMGTDCERANGSCFSCSAGYFSEDCTKACPGECNRRRCDIKTGHCSIAETNLPSSTYALFGILAASIICTGGAILVALKRRQNDNED